MIVAEIFSYAYPAEDDYQNAGHVDINQKVALFPSQVEAHLQDRETICIDMSMPTNL